MINQWRDVHKIDGKYHRKFLCKLVRVRQDDWKKWLAQWNGVKEGACSTELQLKNFTSVYILISIFFRISLYILPVA